MSSFYRGAKHVPSGSLFDLSPKAPYVSGSETSKAAGESIEPTADSLRGRILGLLRGTLDSIRPRYYLDEARQGLTDEQLQEWLKMPSSTERPRRIELVALGLVRDSGRKRKTRSGRLAVVWEAV